MSEKHSFEITIQSGHRIYRRDISFNLKYGFESLEVLHQDQNHYGRYYVQDKIEEAKKQGAKEELENVKKEMDKYFSGAYAKQYIERRLKEMGSEVL